MGALATQMIKISSIKYDQVIRFLIRLPIIHYKNLINCLNDESYYVIILCNMTHQINIAEEIIYKGYKLSNV